MLSYLISIALILVTGTRGAGVAAAAGAGVGASGRVGSSLPVVILDTDIGTDFDDCFALHYLLSISKPADPRALIDLKLVQVSTFNTTKRAQIAAFILDSLGRFDVELAIGDYGGEQAYPEWPLARDYDLRTFVAKGGRLSAGTARMAALMAGGTPAAPVFVTEIAPATSLGGVLMAQPALAAGTAVVAMSGSLRAGYHNSSTIAAEYNVRTNVSASQAMYGAAFAAPLVTAPLDTTVFDQFVGDTYGALLAANASGGAPYAASLLAHYASWWSNGGSKFGAMLPFSPYAGPAQGTSTMYDVQAAWATPYLAAALAASAAPSFPWLRSELVPLTVNGTGFTVPDPAGRPCVVQAQWAPVDRTRDLVANFGAEVIAAVIAG